MDVLLPCGHTPSCPAAPCPAAVLLTMKLRTRTFLTVPRGYSAGLHVQERLTCAVLLLCWLSACCCTYSWRCRLAGCVSSSSTSRSSSESARFGMLQRRPGTLGYALQRGSASLWPLHYSHAVIRLLNNTYVLCMRSTCWCAIARLRNETQTSQHARLEISIAIPVPARQQYIVKVVVHTF